MVSNKPERINKTSHFNIEAEKLKLRITSEMNAHKLGQSKDGTLSQLELIYKDIELMIETKSHKPSYPMVITDSWDYNSELGIQLLDLYERYKKLG